ncbi:hypothetical protein CKO28_09145 [Rhodovibrio sodomensis]|uniref:Response regulatory domain-containing protein n=2 Tax=Rhodovibrio sodomensis TaxID=1088 RepID=A0ABS1DCM0_9PROT|nr:hypothetical protein [Rhodovibrio sodomensis]
MAKVLVVDDEKSVRMALRKTLERDAHEVLEAEDGDVALSRLADTMVDVVITDILMPGREGIETIQEIRETYGRLPRIIAISGGGQTGKADFLDFTEQFGANRVLEKPISRDQAMRAVREEVEIAQSARESGQRRGR